jgi:hypothetical protein
MYVYNYYLSNVLYRCLDVVYYPEVKAHINSLVHKSQINKHMSNTAMKPGYVKPLRKS